MRLNAHLSVKRSDLAEFDHMSTELPGRLPAVMLALKQQALIQNEVARMIQNLDTEELEQLESLAGNHPILLRALHRAGVVRVKPTRPSLMRVETKKTLGRSLGVANSLNISLEINSHAEGEDIELPQYLSTRTVSEILDITPQMVRRYCQDQQLKATRTMGLAGDWRIDTHEFIKQDGTRLPKLERLLRDRANRNRQLAETVEKLAEQPGVKKLLDDIDNRREDMDRRRDLGD